MNQFDVDMIPVSSSNVESIGYNDRDQTLYVQFLSGSLYIYKNVPSFEFENLRNAPSIGSYLNRNIKGAYSYERIG